MSHIENNILMIARLNPHTAAMATKFAQACEDDSLPIWIVQGRRTPDEQHALYRQGRDSNGNVIDRKIVVTWADNPKDSPHVRGGAIDAAPLIGGKIIWTRMDLYARMAVLARQSGLVCGMDWAPPKTDTDHYEDPQWRNF